MSEVSSQGSSVQGTQTATVQSPNHSRANGQGSSVPSTASGSPAPRKVGSGESLDVAKNSRSKDTTSSNESARTQFSLPDELDLDTLDEESLKKLAKWKKKVKVNGREEVINFDQMMRYSQKEFAADKKMKEASEATKKLQILEEALRSDPGGVLEKLGLDVDELAKQRIAYQLQLQAMSEEQKQALYAKEEAERYKQELLHFKQQQAKQMEEQETNLARTRWAQEFKSAFEQSGLPPDELNLKLAAQFVLANRKAGFKDYSAHDAIPLVKDYCLKMAKFYMQSMPLQDIFKELGDDFDKKVRGFLMERVKNPMSTRSVDSAPATPPEPKDSRGRKFITPDQMRENLHKRFG